VTPGKHVRERLCDLRRAVSAGVVGDDDEPGDRKIIRQIGLQLEDAALQLRLLVVDGDHHIHRGERGDISPADRTTCALVGARLPGSLQRPWSTRAGRGGAGR
jgi:hypothetical protein